MAHPINLFLIVAIICRGAEYLSGSQIIPLGQDLLDRHASLIVIVNDMPYSSWGAVDNSLAAAGTFGPHDVRVGSILCSIIHKLTSFASCACQYYHTQAFRMPLKDQAVIGVPKKLVREIAGPSEKRRPDQPARQRQRGPER